MKATVKEEDKPVSRKTCACCGEMTRGRQWFNRDRGFGLCPKCADWMLEHNESLEDMESSYGVRGVHYDVSE